MADNRPTLSSYVEAERDRIERTLFEWLRIPSISAQPAHAADVRASAEFTAALLREAGMENVDILETPGHPAVYGDWLHAGDDAPTVLVYGHHDVQPVDPLDEWRSPPFEPVIVDGECLARGAIDDKGQVLYEIEAARALLRRDGRLPVNVKFVVEGEEEVGSAHFEDLLVRERERFASDAVVVSDTAMLGVDVPSVVVGMRGLIAYDIHVRTASLDLHSGVFGGAAPNPAHLIGRIVAALHDADGRIAVPGWYDEVRELTDVEKESMAKVPFDLDAWRDEAGGAPYIEGEAGRSVLEQTSTRPSCDVVGITVGYGGDGIKTIVPAEGNVKITFRLVPDQDPVVMGDRFRTWLRAQVPDGVELTITPVGGVAPALTPVEHPYVGALSRAIETVWGLPPLFVREGGSGPEEALGRVLEAPVLFLGVGLPGDRIHAPNERMVMDQFWKGLLAAGELLQELAS